MEISRISYQHSHGLKADIITAEENSKMGKDGIQEYLKAILRSAYLKIIADMAICKLLARMEHDKGKLLI